jgi:hypothetical protein
MGIQTSASLGWRFWSFGFRISNFGFFFRVERPRTRSHHNTTAPLGVSPRHSGECHNDDPIDRSFTTKKPAYFGSGDSRRPDIIHDQDIPLGKSFSRG